MMKKIIHIIFILLLVSCGETKTVVINNNESSYLIDKYASLLEISTSQINNVKLYQFIDQWYGTTYKYGGMSKEGVDCSGFANILYNNVYHKTLERSTKDIVNAVKSVEKNNLQEGDLVFFNIAKKSNSHIGVYLQNNRFVHASTSKGVIISSLDNPYYVKTFNKGGRL